MAFVYRNRFPNWVPLAGQTIIDPREWGRGPGMP